MQLLEEGVLNSGYIDHPGIPIQIIIAIASRIAYIFSNNQNYFYDIIQNSETYILASNILFNIVFLILIYFIGLKTKKYSNSLSLGILFQLSFFSHISLIRITGRLMPEGFMLLPLGLIILLLIKYLYDDEFHEKQRKYIIAFSVLMGWGLATKLSFSPFFIIPFFIIPKFKNKVLVIVLTILCFFIIGFPILSHLSRFWQWGSNMFIHSGKWGHGQANFMDISLISSRLLALFKYDKMIFILLAILFIENLSLVFFRKKFRISKKYFIVSLTSISSVALLALMICKHFALHYFIPALIFKSFFIFLIIYPFMYFLKVKNLNKYFYPAAMLIAIVFMIVSLKGFSNKGFIPLNEQQKKLNDFNTKINSDDILVISAYYAGSPFKEFSLANGFLLSGPAKKLFSKPLKNTYPNTYIYYNWSDDFFNWDKYSDTKCLINQNKHIYIYIGRKKSKDLEIIYDKFRKENHNFLFEIKTIIDNQDDKLYELVYRKSFE